MATHVENQTAVNELSVSVTSPEDQRIVDGWQDELDTAVHKAERGESPQLPSNVEFAGRVLTAKEFEDANANK